MLEILNFIKSSMGYSKKEDGYAASQLEIMRNEHKKYISENEKFFSLSESEKVKLFFNALESEEFETVHRILDLHASSLPVQYSLLDKLIDKAGQSSDFRSEYVDIAIKGLKTAFFAVSDYTMGKAIALGSIELVGSIIDTSPTSPKMLNLVKFPSQNIDGFIDVPAATTTLSFAIETGNAEMVKLFISRGAPLDNQFFDRKANNGKINAMDVAIRSGNGKIVKILDNHGLIPLKESVVTLKLLLDIELALNPSADTSATSIAYDVDAQDSVLEFLGADATNTDS